MYVINIFLDCCPHYLSKAIFIFSTIISNKQFAVRNSQDSYE